MNRRFILIFITSICIGVSPSAKATTALGDVRTMTGWQGLTSGDGGAVLGAGGEAVFRYPDGTRGWYNLGLRKEHDGTRDWRGFYALQIDLQVADDQPVELTALIRIPEQQARVDYLQQTRATVTVSGAGDHRITLPWSAFDFQQAQPAFLKFAQELHLSTNRPITLKSVNLIRGVALAMDAPVHGKSAGKDETVEYLVQVTNCSDQPRAVTLSFEKHGWESMQTTVEPSVLQLKPDETAHCTVRVKVPARVAPGGHEQQVLVATPNGDGSRAVRTTFVTAAELAHPYVLHTAARWQAIRDNVAKYDWAKAGQREYVERADGWQVPEIAKPPRNLTGVDNFGPFLFATTNENGLMACGISYQLTGEKRYAEEVRTFLLRLSDPRDGYPMTLRGCNQSLVQEGHFFQHIAMAYDMALPSGIFTDADRAQIENTFRLFIETIEFESEMGTINNWNLSEICGALYCGLAMQDLAIADRFFNGPTGVVDQLGKGVLDDGWWYECAISYNVWCATEFTQVALAMEPWGVNFRDMNVPVNYTPNYGLRPWEMTDGMYGMSFQKWGPITRNQVNIKHMWDAIPLFTDYRGVIFGVNDATERNVTGEPYEIAYYVYRDPTYATLIKQGGSGKRDLIYAVPELPEKTPEKFRDSAFADNVGVAMLRSQAENRPIDQQIQAVVHYGTHGGFHGHFDRTNLLSLMRFGQSFYNPEMIWYSYAPFMYKFYVQTSMSKNMVVVDQKMQEPVESQRLLFHAGKLMQATAVETRARWMHEPYGGMVYPEQGFATLEEKAFSEGRSIPIPKDAPAYGATTSFTEPVLQRRLMMVTDDYVVVADYLKGEQEHTFDSLLQIRGFRGLESADMKLIRHDGQMNPNPITAAQFITDCDWYETSAPARATFDDPAFKMDVISVWPPQQQIMVATAPDSIPVEKQVFYTVRGDGRTLAEGKFGAWILGNADIDVPLAGVKQLVLETSVKNAKRPTIFWGDARIVASDGREQSLSALPVTFENVVEQKEAGKDYFGGAITIVGDRYERATPGEPKDIARPATIRIDLSGLNATRFRATLGGDYPLGNQSDMRKTYSVRSRGKQARFLTVIEPHQDTSVIRRAIASNPDKLTVELTDGRTQEIEIRNLEAEGTRIGVSIHETRAGAPPRDEATARQ